MEIATTDYHTAGEPFRIVREGALDIPARRWRTTIAEKATAPAFRAPPAAPATACGA
jgi:hypothetical protein